MSGRWSICREQWHVPQRVRGLEIVEVVAARGSGVVSMAVAKDGSLWAWGKSKRGQLGLGANVIHAQTPQRVGALSGQHVVQVIRYWSPLVPKSNLSPEDDCTHLFLSDLHVMCSPALLKSLHVELARWR